MRHSIILLTVAFLIVSGWIPSQATSPESGGFVTVKGERFFDAQGRNLILRGINIGYSSQVDTEGKPAVIWNHGGPEAFEKIRNWGFNCVRLVLYWSAVEPDCGTYSETFLKDLDNKISWAKANRLFVILDMHQDLWGLGVPGARGAPEWALVDKTPEHIPGKNVWSEAYFTSPLVQTAFDNFLENKPGPNGDGIQDRFALAWRHLAARYADEPAVVGYDLLNEPSAGSPIREAFMAMTLNMVPTLSAQSPDPLRTDPVELAEAVMAFAESDIELYKQWLSGGDSLTEKLDRERIVPMYQRVADAIREVDARHILFTSATICSNFGLRNGIQRILANDGNPDPLQAFSPHIYDDDRERIGFTFGRLVETSRKLEIPLLVGEWGNLTNSDRIFQQDPIEPTKKLVQLFDEVQASDTYWYYMEDLDRQSYFQSILQRPYPMSVCGEIERYAFDSDKEEFICEWIEDPKISAESVFYLPSVWYGETIKYQLDTSMETHRHSTSSFLSIPVVGEAHIRRRLIVQGRMEEK